jgi:GNAT superfamily N-acetyltransferase
MRSEDWKTEVRAFGVDEGSLLRQIRLTALRDSPDSFGARLADEASMPDRYWLDRVRGEGQFAGSRSFLASAAGEVVGMAGCYPEASHRYRLFAMWVAPVARRMGVGADLIRGVEQWARRQGATELVAAVFQANAQARRFYHAQGFKGSGDGQGSDIRNERSELQLTRIIG